MSLCGTPEAEEAPACPLVLLDGLELWLADELEEGAVDCEEEEDEGEVEL